MRVVSRNDGFHTRYLVVTVVVEPRVSLRIRVPSGVMQDVKVFKEILRKRTILNSSRRYLKTIKVSGG